MSKYYIMNQKLVGKESFVSVGGVDSDVQLDPVALTRAVKLEDTPSYIKVSIKTNVGSDYPDIFTGLINLYSDRLKNVLDDLGIKNIDYYPVTLIDDNNNIIEKKYWFSQILGCISALDLEKTEVETGLLGDLEFESFHIDSDKTNSEDIFRLGEDPTLVIISEKVYNVVSQSDLLGVKLLPTTSYDGYGF